MIEYTNEDCMAGMARYPDKYFDLAIVDPPYGIGNFIPQNMSKTGKTISSPVSWNNEIPPDIYFTEVARVSEKQIIWGANYYNCFGKSGGAIIWNKGEANPVFSQCEIASLSFQKRVDYVLINWQSGFHREKIEHIIHACQKPVALYKWLLKNYAKPNDKILDTHVGSASSLIACYDMNFDAVGFELDKDYFDKSTQRLEDFMRQPKLDELMQVEWRQTEI